MDCRSDQPTEEQKYCSFLTKPASPVCTAPNLSCECSPKFSLGSGKGTLQVTEASCSGWDGHRVLLAPHSCSELCATRVLLQRWPATRLPWACGAGSTVWWSELCHPARPRALDSPTRRHCLSCSLLLWPLYPVSMWASMQQGPVWENRPTKAPENSELHFLPVIAVLVL